MTIKFLLNTPTEEVEFEYTVPGEITFGTNNGYYWIDGLTDPGTITKYGIQKVGNFTSPVKRGEKIMDATWYDSFEDWHPGDWFWPISVGSEGNMVTPTF